MTTMFENFENNLLRKLVFWSAEAVNKNAFLSYVSYGLDYTVKDCYGPLSRQRYRCISISLN